MPRFFLPSERRVLSCGTSSSRNRELGYLVAHRRSYSVCPLRHTATVYAVLVLVAPGSDSHLLLVAWSATTFSSTTRKVYDRPVLLRPSSFIRIEGMTLKRLLPVELVDFAEGGAEP